MRRFGLTVALFLAVLLAGLAFVYYGAPRFIQPELIRAQILQPLEKNTAGSLTYSGFEFSYFPRFKVTFLDVRLKGTGSRGLETQAARIEIEPDTFPLLIRQFRVRYLKVEDADIDIKSGPEDPWTSIQLRGVTAEALPLGTLKAMRIRAQGVFAGNGGSFEGDVRLNVKSFSDWNWTDTVIQGIFKADSDNLKGLYASLGMKNTLTVEKGTGHAKINLKKEKGFNWISTSGEMQCSQMAYGVALDDQKMESLLMDISLDFESTLDPVKSEWSLRRSTFHFPPGKVELSGQGNYQLGEIQDLRFSASEIQLEQIPSYFVMSREALPFNIGFSGLGQVELSLKGTREKMNIYLNSDLAPAVLTYGRFLDKPKGVPFSVVLDAVVQGGQDLNGDLSVRVNEVLAKGTVKDLNLGTGEGQINLITNKHSVESWGPLIPFLHELELSGGMKMLANWEGDLHNLEKVKKVFNLTIEDGRAARKDAEISQIGLELDYDSAMGLVIKQFDGRVGAMPVKGQLSVYNPAQEAVLKLILSSPEADFTELLSVLGTFFSDVPEFHDQFESLKQWLTVPPAAMTRGKNFLLETELKDGRWKVEKLGLDVGTGRLLAKGSVKNQDGRVDLETHLEINKSSLDLLFPLAAGKELSSGELFVNADFSGKNLTPQTFFQEVKGSGSLLINKASFFTFDLFQALGQIPDFSALQPAVGGPSFFEDIRGHFRRENGKFVSEDLVFLSRDFSVDAKGDLSQDGQFNFRLELYLSQEQARKVLGDSSAQMGLGEGEWFGPVPLLLTGTLATPELRSDPEAAGNLLTRVQRGDTQGAFRNFLREDTLFDDFKKN